MLNIIEQCKELFDSLSEPNQKLIARMLTSPNTETWLEARRIVISSAPLITLEMAVKRISNSPVSNVPDSFTIYRALKYASEKMEHYQRRPSVKDAGNI
jgi:hypothetical protein